MAGCGTGGEDAQNHDDNAYIMDGAYVLFTDYGYYHHSIRGTVIVSGVHYVSAAERKMSGDCRLQRNTCSGLYSHDTTWWQG